MLNDSISANIISKIQWQSLNVSRFSTTKPTELMSDP